MGRPPEPEPSVPLARRLHLRPGHWTAIDCTAAVVLAWVYTWGPGTVAEDLLGVVVALPLAVRRRLPLPALAIVLAGSVPLFLTGTVRPFPALAAVVYTVAVSLPRRPATVGLLASLATIVAVELAHRGAPGSSDMLLVTVLIVAVWSTGFALRQNRAYSAALLAHAERRGDERLVEERLRIARELHDVIAHSMSLISVQAGVANYVVHERPEEAASALASIETTSREALREVRRLLGVLRDSDGERVDPELAPAPGIKDLRQLTSRASVAGVEVELQIRGDAYELPAGVELAAYRIVQEALTNVVRHAGTNTGRVVLSYEKGALAIEITDRGRGPVGSQTGHGIPGMRERVGLYGGCFHAGPRHDGGFAVTARLPLVGSTP